MQTFTLVKSVENAFDPEKLPSLTSGNLYDTVTRRERPKTPLPGRFNISRAVSLKILVHGFGKNADFWYFGFRHFRQG